MLTVFLYPIGKKNSEGDNVRGVQKEGCEYCTVDIVIDIFNSSMKSKLIRDINIEILNSHKKKIIGEVVISSNNIQMVEPYSLTIYPTILDRYSVRYYIRNDEIKSITETLYIYMNYKKYKQVTCKRNIFYGSISVSAY